MKLLIQFVGDKNVSKCRPLMYTLLLISSTSSLSKTKEHDQCLAITPSGTYRGCMNQSVLTMKEFCSFLGIRYGRPPLGDLRFEHPLPAESLHPWMVVNATKDGNSCVQIRSQGPEGSEDCLFLNVFTPEPPQRGRCQLKPVLVFVHPGGFFFGSGSSNQFSFDFIAEKDVIFVTINYRLNVFGFLNYNVSQCGGNMGLRDVALALTWVRANIMSFGGDPNRVTLAGESAGALAVLLVAISPLSRGYVNRVISQSPVYQNFLSLETKPASIDFAKCMGYTGNIQDPDKIIQYLKHNVSANDLVLGYDSFTKKRSDKLSPLSYQPFVPSPDASLGGTAFFPGTLAQLGGKVPDIDFIVGQDDLDGAYPFSPNNLKQLISNVRHRLGDLFPPSAYSGRNLAKLKRYYFGHAKTTLEQLISAINALTDSIYFNFYQQLSVLRRSLCNRHIWVYQFRYNGTFEHFKMQALGNYTSKAKSKGAVHGEELNYQYYARIFYPNFTPASLTKSDRKILDELATLWTNFVKTGNPNSCRDGINHVEWKPISSAQKSYLQIGSDTYFFRKGINEDRRRVLDSLLSYPKKDNDPCYCRAYNQRRRA